MNKRFYEDNKAQFYKNVFALVLPMALQNLINVGVTSADVIMLGKVGEIALSASSLAGQIYFILSLILFGLTSGAAVITAQYWGKKEMGSMRAVAGITLVLGMIISLLFGLAAFCFPKEIMGIFSVDVRVINLGAKYIKIMAVTLMIYFEYISYRICILLIFLKHFLFSLLQ